MLGRGPALSLGKGGGGGEGGEGEGEGGMLRSIEAVVDGEGDKGNGEGNKGEGMGGWVKERVCMVGDRLDTDIAFGVQGGLGGTLCVLTGVTRGREDWEKGGVRPGFWCQGLGDLSEGWDGGDGGE